MIRIIAIAILLTGCATVEKPAPISDPVLKLLSEKYLGVAEIIDFTTLSSETTGTDINPVVNTEFTAIAQLFIPVYKKESQLRDTYVLSKTYDKGFRFEILGASTSAIRDGKWKTSFPKLQVSPSANSMLSLKNLDQLNIPYVIENSLEHKELHIAKKNKIKRFSVDEQKYYSAIKNKISNNWMQPSTTEGIVECEVHIIQGPGGIILDYTFGNCPGSREYRLSVETAILNSEPLPLPGHPGLFQRDIRLNFKPEEPFY